MTYMLEKLKEEIERLEFENKHPKDRTLVRRYRNTK